MNRLRNYLNEDPASSYDTEVTMYDDHDGDDADTDQAVAGLMHATHLGPDDEDMDEDVDVGEGSQYGAEADV